MPVFPGPRRIVSKSPVVAAVFILTVLLCTDCAGNRLGARRSYNDYWGALAELHPDAAAKYSRTFSQRLFALSLKYLMEGKLESAEVGFASLQVTADDSLLRAGARVAYSAVLQHEEKWGLLSKVRPFVAANRDADRAGVERWAAVFAEVPPKTVEFRSRLVILPLTLSAVTTPTIPVRVNGKDYQFWLDTGSSLTIVSSRVGAALGLTVLSPDTLEMVTSTGRVSARPTLIDRIELGQISVRNAAAMIVDESSMEMRDTRGASVSQRTTPVKIDGIIGYDVIQRLDIEIDYGEARVSVRNPAERRGAGAARNLFWLGVPVVRLFSANGTPLHFGLDTGAQESFGTKVLFDKLEMHADSREARRVGGLSGSSAVQAPIVHELTLTVRDHPLVFRDLVIYAPVYRTLVSLDGVLGADVTKAGVVRMDATNGIFSVNEGVRKSTLN